MSKKGGDSGKKIEKRDIVHRDSDSGRFIKKDRPVSDTAPPPPRRPRPSDGSNDKK